MSKTKIEWTDSTWNPIRARNKATGGVGHFCVHVSPGCEHCYAERMQPRFGNLVRYAAQDRGKVELFLDENVLRAPLSWKKPRRVFVCSMTDLFLDDVPDEWIDKIFAVMAPAPQHTFQVLTKRAERMRAYFAAANDDSTKGLGGRWCRAVAVVTRRHPGAACPFPLPNVHLGVSVEDQQRADERIPILLDTPAAVRFVSAEPLLGPVDLSNLRQDESGEALYDALRGGGYHRMQRNDPGRESWVWRGTSIDWVIVGGESGPKARPCDLAWIRSIVNQCRAAGVPCFVKQIGTSPYLDGVRYKDGGHHKGGDPVEWPVDLRIRRFPR